MTGPVGAAIVPVLEVGGTHVAGGLVDVAGLDVIAGSGRRVAIRPDGSAQELIGSLASCARDVAAGGGPDRLDVWGVAMPGPFEYETGIGRFEGVGKFASLYGVDVGAALREALGAQVRLAFLNDADAFALGEWAGGGGRGHDRLAALTLGTGIGSAFLDRGRIVDDDPSVPPEGRVDLLTWNGRPLEDSVSRRALIAAFGGDPGLDVHDIAMLARDGDRSAAAVFEAAFDALGRAVGPWIARFGATGLVVGGSITESWSLVEPSLSAGLIAAEPALNERLQVRRAQRGVDAPLIGAALHAVRRHVHAGTGRA